MIPEISIAARDTYTSAGAFDTTLYVVLVDYDDEPTMDLPLNRAEDLIILRDALTEYIERHNLTASNPNTSRKP